MGYVKLTRGQKSEEISQRVAGGHPKRGQVSPMRLRNDLR